MFFIFCAFPSILPLSGESDIQPWAFLLSIVMLLVVAASTSRVSLPKSYRYFLLVGALFIPLYLLDLAFASPLRENNPVSGARLLFSIVSLPLVSLVVPKLRYPLTRRVFFAVYLVWLGVALVQLVVPGFAASLLPRLSTSETRGVVALAPEPDHYGRVVIAFTVLAFFLYICGEVSRRFLLWVVCLSAFQIIFLSRALTSALIFVVVTLPILWQSFTARTARLLIAGAFAVALGIVGWVGFLLLPDARIFMLIRMLAEDPSFWTTQGGFIARFLNPFLSIQVGLVETAGRGAGLGSTPLPGQVTVLWPFGFQVPLPDRAHGGLVGLVYSAGIVGALYVGAFYWTLLAALRGLEQQTGKRVLWSCLIAMTMIYFFDQSVADPLHAYLLGYLILQAGRRNTVVERSRASPYGNVGSVEVSP